MNKLVSQYWILGICFAITGCAPTGRYYQTQDSAPKIVPAYVTKKDATPKYEPYAPANMRSYTVRGVQYHPLKTGLGFSDTGQASWYGQKFHGHKTSNGEIYDMYQMSAAHKTLPLPSYARITNLDNGKQVVVKINDRGPFHIKRIVDVSYAAAVKLDMLKTGVANVKLDVIHVDPNGKITIGKQTPIEQKKISQTKKFVQVVALSNKQRIQDIGNKLNRQLSEKTRILSANGIHKLQLGPLSKNSSIPSLLAQLKSLGYPKAYLVNSH